MALNTLHEGVPPGNNFTAESTEAMRLKCLAQRHNMLMLPGFEPSTSVSRKRHPNHMTKYAIVVNEFEDDRSDAQMDNKNKRQARAASNTTPALLCHMDIAHGPVFFA